MSFFKKLLTYDFQYPRNCLKNPKNKFQITNKLQFFKDKKTQTLHYTRGFSPDVSGLIFFVFEFI